MSLFYYPEPKCMHSINKARLKGKKIGKEFVKKLDKLAPALQASLTKGIRSFANKASFDELLKAAKSGKIIDIDKIAPWEKLVDEFEEIKGASLATIKEGSKIAEKSLPTVIKPKFAFDTTNPRIGKYIDKEVGAMIKDLTKSSKAAIDKAVRTSFDMGMNPRRAATVIKDSIGLNERQANAMLNLEAKLTKQGVEGSKLTKMLDIERDKKLTFRSKMIARTETMNSLNNGHQEVWAQAADEGLIDPDKTMKRWIIAPGACEICVEMEGEEALLNEPWITANGPVMTPSEVHPNCNCSFEIIPALK